MISGNGMLARAFSPAFENRKDVHIFAAGTSDSTCTDPAVFDKEEVALREAMRNVRNRVVYFSTTISTDAGEARPYFAHKRRMEAIVLAQPNGYVFRLSQVVGDSSRASQLTNFLYEKVRSGDTFELWGGATRCLIDVEDVVNIVSGLLASCYTPHLATVVGPALECPIAFVRHFERMLDRTANFTMVAGGGGVGIDRTETYEPVVPENVHYVRRLLTKYYGSR